MRRKAAIVGLLSIGLMGLAAQPAHAVQLPTLVRIMDLAAWATPSSDPMGIAYDSAKNRLLVVDSEIEETVPGQPGPHYWQGANFYELSLSGTLERTVNIATISDVRNPDGTWVPNPGGYTDEPGDVAYNPADGGHYYIIDDNRDLVHDVRLMDGNFDAGDPQTSFSTRNMTGDPEGIGFGVVDGEPNLFIAAGEGPLPPGDTDMTRIHQIFRLRPGPNGVFDGPQGTENPNGDDVMTHFDTCDPPPATPENPTPPCSNPIDQHDPEDVAYDAATGHLYFASRDSQVGGGNTFVAEVTLNGDLVDTYDLGNHKGFRPSGIVVAPASSSPGATSFYIADRGVDNNSDALSNDGEVYEFQLGGLVNRPPVITNPGSRLDDEGAPIELQIPVTDPEDDPFTVTATGLPPTLTMNPAGLITGTVPMGSGGTYATRVTATDVNNLTRIAQFQWVIRDVTPPAAPLSVDIIRHTNGVALSWPDSPETDWGSYDVLRSATGAEGSWATVNTAPVTASDYFDDTAPSNATSFYRVVALDRSGNISLPVEMSAHRSKIVFVSSSTARGSGMTMSIKRPADVASGDVLLAAFYARGATSVLPPAGWTLASQLSHTPSVSHQAIFSRTVGVLGSEPTSYAFNFVGRNSAVGMILAYRGAAELPAISGGQANPANTSIFAPSLSPTVADSVQVAFFGAGTTTSISAGIGMIERGEAVLAKSALRATLSASDVILDPGAIGVREATATDSAASIGQVVVLRPAP